MVSSNRRLALAAAITGAFIAPLACGSADAQDQAAGAFDACQDGEPTQERYGTDCLCCHGGDLSVAGSVDRANTAILRIEVEDAQGARLVMPINAYGNFFQHLNVVPPLIARRIDEDGSVHTMKASVQHGSCNQCHTPEADGLLGRELPP